MSKMLFLPNAEQASKMIEDAWLDFRRQAKENGLAVEDDTINGLLKDIFAAGYSYGYNDMLGIIRDQMDAEYQAKCLISSR